MKSKMCSVFLSAFAFAFALVFAASLSACSTDVFAISDADPPDSFEEPHAIIYDGSGGDAVAADGPVSSDATDTGADAGDAGIADAAPPDKTIFISSVTTESNVGSLAAADAICAACALDAGLPGTYRAWLSTSVASAAARLTHSTTPYRLVDGTLVAKDWSALTGGAPLDHDIDLDEHGAFVPENTSTFSGYVWTGTNPDGGFQGESCNDWTVAQDCSISTTYKGSVGCDWSASLLVCGSPACCTVQLLAFYCLEQ